jgi:hypothetical protein
MQFCICNCCYAQKKILDKKHYVVWKENLDFSWDYFLSKRKPSKNESVAASISVGLSSSTKIREKKNTIICYIQTYLDKKRSWSIYCGKKKHLINSLKSKYLLNHELVHFHIGEIYSRECRKLIAGIQANSFEEAKKDIERIIAEISDKRLAEHNKYDEETEHSKNEEKQAEWDKKVAERLKELEQYKDIAVVIRLQ